MKPAMMNDPRREPLDELRWAARHGFRAFDLTLEAPAAAPETFPARAFGDLAQELGVEVVGHTVWYLSFGSPVERLRRAAVEEMSAQLPIYQAAGARRVNLHPYLQGGLVERKRVLRTIGQSFSQVADRADELGLGVMAENMPGESNPREVGVYLADPRVGFHLDVGHAAIGPKDFNADLLARFGSRLVHVHLSDNKRQRDEHLPLGAGRVEWRRALGRIKALGYEGMITLEIFSDDRDLLLFSRDRLVQAWESASAPAPKA